MILLDVLLTAPLVKLGLFSSLRRSKSVTSAVSAQLCPPQNASKGPLMVIYKKKLCYATSQGRIDFKTKYSNCRHNFGRTRPVASIF